MKYLYYIVAVFILFNANQLYSQWDGNMTYENDVVIVKNTGRGVWEKSKKMVFAELATFGESGNGYLAMPFDMTTDLQNNIYVTDFQENCIKVFDPDGTMIKRIGRKGQGPGEVNELKAIAYMKDDKFCICQEWMGLGNEVILFKLDGTYITKFQTPTAEDGCNLTVSLDGKKIYLSRDINMFLGSDYFTKSNADMSFLISTYDVNGGLINTFGSFEDIGKISGEKYYSESTFITTLGSGDIAAVHQYPYVIKIYSEAGNLKRKITRPNKLFKPLKVSTRKIGESEFLNFYKPTFVQAIINLANDIFMVIINDNEHTGKDKYVYDVYNYDGQLLKSFRSEISMDYADTNGFLYDITMQEDIPVIKKYEMTITTTVNF